MAAGKTRAAEAVARAPRPRCDRHRRAAGGRARRVDRLVLRARGRGRVPRAARSGWSSRARRLAAQVGGPSSVVALGGGAVESEAGAPRPRRAYAGLVRRRGGGRLGARVADRGRPLAADRDGSPSASPARRPVYESLARAILPSAARGGAGRPRSVARPLCGARPPCAWPGPTSDGGSYPAVVGPGAIGAARGGAGGRPRGLPARIVLRRRLRCARGSTRELLPAVEATDRGRRAAEPSKTLAEAERVLRELAARGRPPRRLRARLRRRRRRRSRRVLRRDLPARGAGRAGADTTWSPRWTPPTAARPGWTCPRRRTTSAPTTSRSPCWPIPTTLDDPARRGAGGRVRRGREDRPDRRAASSGTGCEALEPLDPRGRSAT